MSESVLRLEDVTMQFGGVIAVNRGTSEVAKTFRIDEKIEGSGKLYVYIFNEKNLRLGEDGFVVPSVVSDGSLNENFEITLPAGSVAFISSERL